MYPSDLAIRLGRRLDVESARLRDLDALFNGENGGAALLAERFAGRPVADLLKVGSNWSRFALGATAERLALAAFTTEGKARPDLWGLWRRSVPASSEALLWRNVLRHGRGYLTSWGDETGAATITVDSARTMCHETDARGATTVAARRWVDAGGRPRMTLYLPDRVVRVASAHHVAFDPDTTSPDALPVAVTHWETVEVIDNPLGRVVVSPVVLRREVRDWRGESDLEPLRGTQAAIDKTLVDLLVISESLAAPRRWATGVEVPLDPETGEAVDPFAGAGPGRFLVVEAAEANLGPLPAADLEGPLALLERLVEDLLARAAVPRHLAIGGARGQQVNAESVRAAEAGLLARVAARQAALGDGVARAVRLAEEVASGRPGPFVEPRWRPAATATMSADADAVAKLVGVGLDPIGVAALVLGLDPAEAEKLRPAAPSGLVAP